MRHSSLQEKQKQNKYITKSASWVSHKLKIANSLMNSDEDKNLNLAFLKAFIANPCAIGSVIPSSKALANEMASHACLSKNEIVLELGAGTGVITQAILASGIQPNNLIVIEYSPELVKKLRPLFPGVQIIEGDAGNLQKLLCHEKRPIKAVISSLPLRSLPKTLTNSILQQISQLLPEGGKYIQYTYSFTKNKFKPLSNCRLSLSKRIWMNFPPARIDVMTKHSAD